ncbi:hypothetical protein ACN20G_03340 [Streptomyces sp. BI20]|uniref:hypothetical protein n=1 Tax=Streptomyces sp. BI20 TaxID=3403460 RepID=UPI003C72AA63
MDEDDPRVHRALAVPSRRRLWAALRAADDALDVPELVGRCGPATATVRHHLAVLVDAGLVTAEHAPTGDGGRGPGRPRLRYRAADPASRATPPPSGATEALVELATGLAESLAGAAPDAQAAGLRCGLARAARTAPGRSATRRVLELTEGLGFAPRRVPGESRVLLEACPYREPARARPEIVCAFHQGVLDGLLTGTDQVATLRPFTGPRVCAVDLSPRPDPA